MISVFCIIYILLKHKNVNYKTDHWGNKKEIAYNLKTIDRFLICYRLSRVCIFCFTAFDSRHISGHNLLLLFNNVLVCIRQSKRQWNNNLLFFVDIILILVPSTSTHGLVLAVKIQQKKKLYVTMCCSIAIAILLQWYASNHILFCAIHFFPHFMLSLSFRFARFRLVCDIRRTERCTKIVWLGVMGARMCNGFLLFEFCLHF